MSNPEAGNRENELHFTGEGVVVGDKGILLIKRAESEKWTIPGGLIGAGESVREVIKREVNKSTGVDLRNIPAAQIDGRVEDLRGRDPRKETTAMMFIVHHDPQPQADGEVAQDARWFPCSSIEELEQYTGALEITHREIIMRTLEKLGHFKHTMIVAELMRDWDNLPAARQLFHQASQDTVDPLSKGKALRGEAQSAFGMGDELAAVRAASEAYSTHSRTKKDFPETPIILREYAASADTLGRTVVHRLVRQEGKDITVQEACEGAQEALHYFDKAYQSMLQIETLHNTLEPYRIVALSRWAIAHALYGDLSKGYNYAAMAAHTGWQAEAPEELSGEDASELHHWQAKANAVVRGYAALAVSALATPYEGHRRHMARAIALGPFGL